MCDFRPFLTEFITLYKSYPCLWQVDCPDYKNKYKRELAYEALVKKFKEVDPTADKRTVSRKINGLRTVHRRERNKIQRSLERGEEYHPSLWYFNLLSFVHDDSSMNMSFNSSAEDDESTDLEASVLKLEPVEDVQEPVVEPSVADADPLSETASHYRGNGSWSRWHDSVRKRQRADDGVVCGRKKVDVLAEDNSQVFGNYVANKLRGLPSIQSAIAQKLISDVLFEAELGTLNRYFQIVDTANP